MKDAMNNETAYRIAVKVGSRTDARYQRTAYVAKNDGAGTWDGSWYTEHELGQVKYWKTRRGAEKWLAERPGIAERQAVIEEVHGLNTIHMEVLPCAA